MIDIPKEIISTLVGLPCCRVGIGGGYSKKTLSIGLGDKYKNTSKNSRVEYYGEWEFGTYNASWRFIKNNEIIFGYNNYIEGIDTATPNLEPLLNKKLIGIRALSEFDIRFEFSENMIIDILNCFTEDDDVLHFLHVEGFYWHLLGNNKWEGGKSPFVRKKEKS